MPTILDGWLISALAMGLIASKVATAYGLDPRRWFVIGALLNIFAFFALGAIKKPPAKL